MEPPDTASAIQTAISHQSCYNSYKETDTNAEDRGHMQTDKLATPSAKKIEDNSAWPRNLTPRRLLMFVTLLVFCGETIDMLVLRHLPPMPWLALTFIDASLLMVLLSPAYFMLYRPLKTHFYERQRAEREVAFLSRHTLQAVEEEKKRIAHEMHDGCGSLLTAMQFDIETLKLSVIQRTPAAEPQFERLAAITAQLAGEVRSITGKLRPAMLETSGLAPALRWHVSQVVEGRPELHIDLRIDDCADRLPPDIEIAVYRICQEGLNNVVRHAYAKEVIVTVHCGERVRVRIEDDGIGFDHRRMPVNSTGPLGFGLLGMRERAAGLGGRLTVQSTPGQGTVIEADLPATIQENQQ